MRALTLLQPWATLIAHGLKQIETRDWGTGYRGPLAIHASKRWQPDIVEWVMRHPGALPIRASLATLGYEKLADLPLGSVLAVCDLVDCVQVTPGNVPPEPERFFGDYRPGRWAWQLTNIRPLPAPIPAKGNRRLWVPEAPLLVQLEQFYKEAI